MNYTMMPVFTADAICDIFNVQCENEDDKINSHELHDVFWPEDYCNSSYKRLYLEEDKYVWNDRQELGNKIRAAVKSLYPNFDLVLVDVSW